jgi:ABC-2 type transport system permease protein
MPRFWLWFSYIFPSTPGVQGFIKISSMGAALADVRHEYIALWSQAALYFITATFSLIAIKKLKFFNAK